MPNVGAVVWEISGARKKVSSCCVDSPTSYRSIARRKPVSLFGVNCPSPNCLRSFLTSVSPSWMLLMEILNVGSNFQNRPALLTIRGIQRLLILTRKRIQSKKSLQIGLLIIFLYLIPSASHTRQTTRAMLHLPNSCEWRLWNALRRFVLLWRDNFCDVLVGVFRYTKFRGDLRISWGLRWVGAKLFSPRKIFYRVLDRLHCWKTELHQVETLLRFLLLHETR